MLLDWMLLIPALVFGAWASFTDIKEGKIKNICIILLIATGFLLNIFITKSFLSYPEQSILNILFAVFASVLLWITNLWSAGDSKLFIGFSVLVPVTLFANSGYLPAMEILINSILPAFILLSILALLKMNREQIKQMLKFAISSKNIANFTLRFFVIFCTGKIIFGTLGISMNIFTSAVFFFLMFWILGKLVPDKNSIYAIFSFPILIWLIYSGDMNIEFLINFAMSDIIFFIVIVLLGEAGKMAFSREVSLNKLKPGMIVSEFITENGGKYEKNSVNYGGLIGALGAAAKTGRIPEHSIELKVADIEKIRKLCKSGKIRFKTLLISDTIPFAPLIAMGCIITILMLT